MAEHIATLSHPNDTKQFLAAVKKVLDSFKLLEDSYIKNEILIALVNTYLSCPARIPAKRVIASFFQNLTGELQSLVKHCLSQQLSQKLCVDWSDQGSIATARNCVDCISALMENFKLGESCLSTCALKVVKFLAEAEQYFLSQVHDNVPPVHLNEVMHHCHVTVQTLNLVLQKAVVGCAGLTQQIVTDTELMTSVMDLNLTILRNEMFLLDCRCCCAMNAVVLLQLSLTDEQAAMQIPFLILPKAFENSPGAIIPWLTPQQAQSLNMETMTTLSYLAMAFGYTASCSAYSIVQENHEGHFFYLNSLLPELLIWGKKCMETSSKALFGKAVQLWTSKLLNTVQSTTLTSRLKAKLNSQSPTLHSLLEFVWTHSDDQLDAVRQSSKSVFENVIRIHALVNDRDGLNINPFLESILTHLFSASWSSRGKFSALTSCVGLVGAQVIVARRPQLPIDILMQFQEQALSCYASELYIAMFISHKQELSSHSDVKTDWRSVFLFTWVDPVVKALCSPNRKLKKNIIEYLLSKLMKADDKLLSYMIHRLREVAPDRVHCAVVMCLRQAQVLGQLRSAGSDSDLWCGCLPTDVLRAALCNCDEQIRLDAFALLCDSYKTTEVITDTEFSLLKFFIPCNVNNQSPAFRQRFLSLLNKLFFRMKESQAALRRQAKKKMQISVVESPVSHYENFLQWLTDHLLSNLYPGSAFARRTTSLAAISVMATYFMSEKDGFAVPERLKTQHLHALMECFADTFEENKREALKICTTYLIHQAPIWEREQLVDVLRVSVLLACSTRPQDCSTAAYNFLLIINQMGHYPNICNLAEMLPLDLLPSSQMLTLKERGNTALLLLNMLLSLLDDQIAVADQSLICAAANRPMYPTLHCIMYIMQELDFRSMPADDILATKDFIQRLITSCLNVSRVVSPVVQNSSPEGNIPEAVLGPGLNINCILQPGHSISHQAATEDLDTSRAVVESMPEYLVVCCWRSIKEVSLTLGKMCLQIPASQISEHNTDTVLFSMEQISVIGEYFTTQLLESVHRGAFELAYAGFQLMCQMLWNHPASCFHQLPARWLTDVLATVKTDDPESKLCSTRRSAGVPFFVQAVTSTEPAATGRKCFHSVMVELLPIAISGPGPQQPGSAQTSGHAQVHALNILRALFRDSRLGEEVVQYIADGLKASILGFKSEQWAVRNCATLLLSALMTRMFGVKRSKDESNMSKKNCQTGRAFFHHYPSLYPFLLSELDEATADVGSKLKIHLSPSLYPVLLVLGRLFPSTLEGSDTSLSLAAFIPYVIRCAASPVYKTRVIASHALQPLARKSQVISISRQLFASLPESATSSTVTSSHIHGSLLQLYQLANLMQGMADEDTLEYVMSSLSQRMWIISCSNSCYMTRQAALVLTDMLLDMAVKTDKKSPKLVLAITAIKEAFLAALMQEDLCSHSLWQPLYFNFEKTKARLCLKYLSDVEALRTIASQEGAEVKNAGKLLCGDMASHLSSVSPPTDLPGHETVCPSLVLLVRLLDSSLYEVRLEVLDILCAVWQSDNGMEKDCEESGHDYEDGDLKNDNSDLDVDSACKLFEGSTQIIVKEHAPALFGHLLKMAMETEAHHECLQKVFSVLSIHPCSSRLLLEKSREETLEMLTSLLIKVNKERRVEVKAAMIRFSALLVPIIYAGLSLPVDKNDPRMINLKEWLSVLNFNSALDEYPEMQMSCCQALLKNAKTLLCDPDNKLGDARFLPWDILANLLQEDDLEVKDTAASTLCLVQGLQPGSYHPSFALHCLPAALVSIHADADLPGVVMCLLQWILFDADVDNKESRLFDKGEMNMYRDQVAFTRSIVATLGAMFGLHLKDQLLSTAHTIDISTTAVVSAALSQTRSEIVSHVTRTQSEMLHDSKQTQSGIVADVCQAQSEVISDVSKTQSVMLPHISEARSQFVEILAKCMKDKSFTTFLSLSISSLSEKLDLHSRDSRQTDMYMNSSRYKSLCQDVYRGKIMLSLFDKDEADFCRNSVAETIHHLDSLILRIVAEFGLGGMLIQ